ncbi:MAG: AAA family ATPase [Gammaproteobacteria bacterium]|nr:AAA family ATPase [Gammaproteobacteria bacterium]MYB37938.1 AAA family ATPase [Gammaproteobacteria bacterium]
MEFRVVSRNAIPRSSSPGDAFLETDNWDDFGFRTLFRLVFFDRDGRRHDFGGVKIAKFGLLSGHPDLPGRFNTLGSRFFSLGQDADYYEGVASLDTEEAADLLRGLRDVVADDELLQQAKDEEAFDVSLMRWVNERTLIEQFRRILRGDARLTDYAFQYVGRPQQIDPACDPIEMSFKVEPLSQPPTNVHVLIGRNGVGKSHLLNAMSRALALGETSREDHGWFADLPGPFPFDDDDNDQYSSPFANVVSVAFSAFDDFPVVPKVTNAPSKVQYTNVGLRGLVPDMVEGEPSVITRQPDELSQDFIQSAKLCSRDHRKRRWINALRTLESDPVFEESGVAALPDSSAHGFDARARALFRRLSSGHKIVLLTITRLVETVDERTLVLMDEPESHLHPPFLAAFIRALSDLLISRNGVAIIATHSPVVLQEVPQSCVWQIRRYGDQSVAERVPVETFAEHVGTLTHQVFGLEVTRSGFHKMISDAVQAESDLETVKGRFGGQIGSEGRALIAALIAQGARAEPEDNA